MADTKVSLRLLIDKQSNRVLYAEADKEFVDFLFSILTLPVGTVARLLQKQNMSGCLHSLYESIESLSDTYIQPGRDKDFVLNPKVAISGAKVPLLLPSVEETYRAKIYKCTCKLNNCPYVSNDQKAICPKYGGRVDWELRYIDPPSCSTGGGYVKELVTYMVMDDLAVKPLSTISGTTLVRKFGVRDLGAVEEKVVDFGMDEGVKLLKASLQSKTALSDVFLRAETTGSLELSLKSKTWNPNNPFYKYFICESALLFCQICSNLIYQIYPADNPKSLDDLFSEVFDVK